MAETLELEVATPERELVREQVSEVQLPGKNGYLGVLPGHAPLLGLLGIGTLTYVAGGTTRYLSIHDGFLEILDDHVRVLADCAERAEEIDIERARRALERSQQEAINPALGVEPAQAMAAVMRAEARLTTAQKK
ncbi:MAG: synthase epsilon subunit [Candidatus Solibacter sp.]|jgi:F-type H+-transporting ATPase subunit epsilon|nr:synthase epsilon subunit [Candidatus Solibacter sp.]